MRIFLCFICLLVLGACENRTEICTKQQSELAIKIYSDKKEDEWSWAELYDSYKKFGKCVDLKNPTWNAELATTYEEAVGFLLAEKWDDISQFFEISRKDKGFFSFILFQLDEGTGMDRATLISKNASNNCPPGHESECQAVKTAIEEIQTSE